MFSSSIGSSSLLPTSSSVNPSSSSNSLLPTSSSVNPSSSSKIFSSSVGSSSLATFLSSSLTSSVSSNGTEIVYVTIVGQSNGVGYGYAYNATLDTYTNGVNLLQYVIGDATSTGTNNGVDSYLNATKIVPFTTEAMLDSQPQQYDTNGCSFTGFPCNQLISFVMSFAKTYLSAHPNQTLIIVQSAVQGTSISQWVSSLAQRSIVATNNVVNMYPNATFLGWLWCQGETDAINGDTYSNYLSTFYSLITYFRSNVINATSATPFVVLSMNPYWVTTGGVTAAPTIQSALANIINFLSHTAFVPGAGYPLGNSTYSNVGGIIHYSAAGQRINGPALFTGLNVASSYIVPTPTYYSIGINCGGFVAILNDNSFWNADEYGSGPSFNKLNGCCLTANNNLVTSTFAYTGNGPIVYNVPVPNGNYSVTILIQSVSQDTTVLNSTVNGKSLGSAINMANYYSSAYNATTTLSVTGGFVVVTTAISGGGAGNPYISGIFIQQVASLNNPIVSSSSSISVSSSQYSSSLLSSSANSVSSSQYSSSPNSVSSSPIVNLFNLNINSGGGTVTLPDGSVWVSDEYVYASDLSTLSFPNQYTNLVTQDFVYNQHYDYLIYNVTVPNGVYKVTLIIQNAIIYYTIYRQAVLYWVYLIHINLQCRMCLSKTITFITLVQNITVQLVFIMHYLLIQQRIEIQYSMFRTMHLALV